MVIHITFSLVSSLNPFDRDLNKSHTHTVQVNPSFRIPKFQRVELKFFLLSYTSAFFTEYIIVD